MEDMNPQETPIEDAGVGLGDRTSEDSVDESVGDILSFVEKKFSQAKTARFFDEQRWLRNYRNYRGLYGPDVQFTDAEKSRVFVKVTKTKVLAAYGQIIDVLFGNDKFPIGISPTPVPNGIEESVHFEVQGGPQPATELQPGDTMQSLKDRIGKALSSTLSPVMDRLKPGPGGTQTAITVHPAEVASRKMEKRIHDQLDEANANKKLRSAVFECCLFGEGVLKGPFVVDKEYPRWNEKGEYEPEVEEIPSVSFTSVWNFYPDPDADNMEEAEFIVERHKLSRSKLRELKRRPFFRSKAIDAAISYGENYIEEWWENQIQEETTSGPVERFEALEFWGFVDKELLAEYNVSVPAKLKDEEQLSVNVWVCNGQVLRVVLNPFKPAVLPYHAFPYEINPYSFFGVGVAENMDDTQTLMNGFMRMAVDNAALSGNLIIEIDENNLAPGQDMDIYPGKVFRRQGGAPGQAIFGTKFPNVSNENMQLFDKARVLADESTGLPSFSYGQTGVSGVGRTSSGISMLMSAANGSIRTVVKNIDDYLLAPLGKSLFHWNMQFKHDEDIVGDLEVKARGTESLMANEVRSQRLMQFLGVVQNPVLAPYARMDYIISEIAKSMDLDPDKVTNNLMDAAIQAEIMSKFQQTMTPPEAQQPGAPAVPQPSDTSGAGNANIGVGQAPTPNEQGFSGNV